MVLWNVNDLLYFLWCILCYIIIMLVYNYDNVGWSNCVYGVMNIVGGI